MDFSAFAYAVNRPSSSAENSNSGSEGNTPIKAPRKRRTSEDFAPAAFAEQAASEPSGSASESDNGGSDFEQVLPLHARVRRV